jgi:preprotein translocase subunit SecY
MKMERRDTNSLLIRKGLKIFGFLVLIRLGVYIPVPSIDLELFSIIPTEVTDVLFKEFGIVKSNNNLLGVGSLGVFPYLSATGSIQFLCSIFPSLGRLQYVVGDLGRQQITRYTRYLTFVLTIVLSIAVAFLSVKPFVFNWTLILALKIIFSLTVGSMITVRVAELITDENLGNGSGMLICINILSGWPPGIVKSIASLSNSSLVNIYGTLFLSAIVYIFIVLVIILLQESYKQIEIISAQQITYNYLQQGASKLKSSYIPVKLNQGGIMPIVFSTTLATFLIYLVKGFLNSLLTNTDGILLTIVTTLVSVGLNFVLILFFSKFYALSMLKPKEISDNLNKMAFSVPGIKPGKETTQYLAQVIIRLNIMGSIFITVLICLAILTAKISLLDLSKSVPSLIILVGVISDVLYQVRGFRVTQEYKTPQKVKNIKLNNSEKN